MTLDPANGVDAARWAAAFLMLGVAAWMDLRTRRVANLHWVPFGAFAAVLMVLELTTDAAAAWPSYAIAAGTCALLYLLWRMRLFGGADAKGLMVLAFLLPHPAPPPTALMPTLDTILNGNVLMLAVPFALAAINVARGRWAGLATFLGAPMELAKAQDRHVWPIQRVVDGQVRWRYWPRIGESQAPVYQALAEAGVRTVWVTPKVPLVVLLAVGLLLDLLLGNLALWAASPLLGAL